MRSKLVYLPIIISWCLCPPNPAQDALENYSALNGNWHLIGGWESPLQKTRLNLTMEVDGNKIYADGDILVPDCAGTSFSVIGKIAPDGIFVLNIPGPGKDSPVASIKGKLPAQGSTEWTGSFTAAASAGSYRKCIHSEDFVASRLPPLDGVYSGTIPYAAGFSVPGARLTVLVDLRQGASSSMEEGQAESHYSTITGTITVSGFPGVPSKEITGTAIADHALSRMQGDMLILGFRLEDGSDILLTGSLTDPDFKTVVRASLHGLGKDHPDLKGAIGGELTRR